MSEVTIYHNPDCGTSRNTLALIRSSGIEPRVIEYLKAPPSREVLETLIERMGMPVRALLRVKGTPYRELGLDAANWSDEQLIGHMLVHPILMNRPIVATPSGVRLCRPSDMAAELLPRRPTDESRKEDGSPFLSDEQVAGSDPGLAAALHAAGLPVDDLAEPGRVFFSYSTFSGERVGFGGFEPLDENVLLRSLVVMPAARHRGIGGGMLALLMRRAFDQGARVAWLLTDSAAPFFERAGFELVERSAAPTAILATRQAASLCPASAALLKRAIVL